jgi:hypothetical protein
MTLLQTEFNKFNDAIRLGWVDDQGVLRERRDAIVDQLRDRLDGPTFSIFNQGSYQLGTGVKPCNGDYDIDVGLRFNSALDEWPDPVELKQRVRDALTEAEVEIRRPCVTVYYQRRDEPLYHVDLNVYIPDPKNEGMLYLAIGKEGDGAALKDWRYTDPLALSQQIEKAYPDTRDREQFRRVVRYLKRWKDVKFPSEGVAAPTGIALTAAALQWFKVKKQSDAVANRTHYTDLVALAELVSAMAAHASPRLVVRLPAPPQDDLFARMNEQQMGVFVRKLEALRDALKEARADDDDASTSVILREHLGSDFPELTAAASRRVGAAIVSSGAAG